MSEAVSSFCYRVYGYISLQTQRVRGSLMVETPGPNEGLPLSTASSKPITDSKVIRLIHPTAIGAYTPAPDVFATQIAVQHGFRGRFTGWAIGSDHLKSYLKSINLISNVPPHPAILNVSNEGFEPDRQYLFTSTYVFTLGDILENKQCVFLDILDVPEIIRQIWSALDFLHIFRVSVDALTENDIVIIGIEGNWRAALSSARKYVSFDDLAGRRILQPSDHDHNRMALIAKKCSREEYDRNVPANSQHKRAFQRSGLGHLSDTVRLFMSQHPGLLQSIHVVTHIVFRDDCQLAGFVRDSANYFRAVGSETVVEFASNYTNLIECDEEYDLWFEINGQEKGTGIQTRTPVLDSR